jgi:hypothetical protein
MTFRLPFQPQNHIPDLEREIERLAAKSHSSIKLIQLDESSWLTFLAAHESSLTQTFTPDSLDEPDQIPPFNWTQSESIVTITIHLPASGITVDSTSISSSVLNGIWWTSPTNIEVTDNGDVTQVLLTVTSRWPYLVRGGSPDGLSCYFLAEIALVLKDAEWCVAWLSRGATFGNRQATVSYATQLFCMDDPQAFHFLCRSVAAFSDPMCTLMLARILLREGAYYNPTLAEQLLYRLCEQEVELAFVPLARLYLSGADGVSTSPPNATVLLKLAKSKWGNEEAEHLLVEAQLEEIDDQKSPAVNWVLAAVFAVAFVVVVWGIVVTVKKKRK